MVLPGLVVALSHVLRESPDLHAVSVRFAGLVLPSALC